MPFFTQDQRTALNQLNRTHDDHEELLEFLSGPYEQFLQEKVAPRAAKNDAEELFAADNFEPLGELGMIGLYAPEAYGGMGACFSYYNAALESLAKADAGFALGVAIHGTCCDGLNRFAGEHIKDRLLPDLFAGKKIAAFALSEPDAGSDAKAMKTSYRKDGDHYVLKGSKYWITNAMSADVFFVMAMGPEGQCSSFLVERDDQGTFGQHKIEDKMGVRGSNTAELTFDDHRIPAANLIGEEGNGFRYAMEMLNGGRVTIGAWSTGVAQGAWEKLLKYAYERELFGGRLIDLDNTRREVAAMHIEIIASRNLSYAAAYEKSQGNDLRSVAAVAKVKASETAVYVAERCIELAGGYGYVREANIERHLRDALLARIGEGANELLRSVVIPRALLKAYEKQPILQTW